MEEIIYDSYFGDFTHNGNLIVDLERFVKSVLESGGEVKFIKLNTKDN